MRNPIEALDATSTAEEIYAAVKYVAGMPEPTRQALLESIAAATTDDPSETTSLKMQLAAVMQLRQGQLDKYCRFKLKSYLMRKGTNGPKQHGGMEIDDPLTPGEKIIVRDACLLNHRPIIEKHHGYLHDPESVIVALISEDELSQHEIPKVDIERLAHFLSLPNGKPKAPTPGHLANANVAAFEWLLKESEKTKPKNDEEPKKEPNEALIRLVATLRMNQRYSIVENGGQISIFDNVSCVAYVKKALAEKLVTEKVWIKPDNVKIIDIWWNYPARAFYDGVCFAPNGRRLHGKIADPQKFNLWTGFAEEGSPGDWSLLKKHLLEVVCDGDETAYEYVLNWLAHMFQYPWDKPGVAIVVWGEKRTGKGTVADAIRAAVGAFHSRMINKKDQAVGKFALSATPLLFTQMEEALFSKDPTVQGPLKSMITDPTENIELKFKTPYEVDSFGRYWFNSNEETPVPITHDEERYFVLKINNSKANDTDYFKAIRQQLYQDGGLAAMVYELKNRDISKFDVRKPPKTKHRDAMVAKMIDNGDRAIAEMLYAGEVRLLNHTTGTEESVILNEHVATSVEARLVVSVLNDTFRAYGVKAADQSKITARLKELGVIDKVRKANKRDNVIGAYIFRPLSKARVSCAKELGIDVEHLQGGATEISPIEQLRDAFDGLVCVVEQYGEFAGIESGKLEAALQEIRSAIHVNKPKAHHHNTASSGAELSALH